MDRERLRQFYLQRGYADVQILSSSADLARERNGFFLNFTVSEGDLYHFGRVGVTSSIPGLAAEGFQPLLSTISGGGVYNGREIDRIIERMVYQAGQQGYAFVEVRPRVEKDTANNIANITFEILPAQRVFIERIDISGNTRTLDRVIRRQFNVVEGDAFNAREIRSAEDRIRGLGYFKTATVQVQDGSTPDRALVDVKVEEQSTGSLSLGGAFSSDEGLTAQVAITERNFLGRGQTVSATVAANTEFGNLEFSFVEPSLYDRDLLGGFSAYFRTRASRTDLRPAQHRFRAADRLSGQRAWPSCPALPDLRGHDLERG